MISGLLPDPKISKIYCYWCEDTENNVLGKYMWDSTRVRFQTITLDKIEGKDNATI